MMKTYPSLKNSGYDFIGDIPSHWGVVSLKHLLQDGNDGIKIGPFGSSLKSEIIREDGYKVYGQGNVINDDFEWGHRHIDEEKFQELSVYEVFPNDIMITMMGTTGKAKVVPAKIKHGIFDSHIIRVRTNHKTFPQFLSMLINDSYYVYHQVKNNSKGSIMEGLNSSIVKALQIVLPPLPEQQAIADFLDRKTAQIDTLIEKKQRQIDLLQEQRTALINHAVTKGLNPKVKMKDSGVEWLGEIPSGWEVVKLKYIGKAFIGLTYNPENITDEENGTLVFRASNVQDGKIVFDDNVYVRMEIPERLITKVGDILICVRSGSRDLIGKNALIDEKSAGHAFGAFMTVFRSDINYFLSYVFKSQLFKVQSGIFNTSTVNQLTQGNLYDFQVAIPPIGEQEEIIQFLNNELTQIDETVNRISKQIELLQEYRTALISEAVTGKVDVR